MMHEAEESPLAHRRLPRLIQGSDTSHHAPSPRQTERTDGIVASTSAANGTAVLLRRCHSGDREEDEGGPPVSSSSSTSDAHTGKLKPLDKEILLKPEVEVSHKSKASTVSDTATDALTDITGDLESGAGNGDSDGSDRGSRTQQLRAWIHRVRQTFGTSFLLLVCAVYASQGFNSFSALAINYFFKDHLKLQPAESQALMTVMMSPWGIKPVYGIISDSLPFFKYHRKSYMILFSSMGAMGFLLLSIPDLIDTPFEAVCVLTVNSLAASVIDVVIDARVVEMSRLDPKNGANDLQSVSWTAMAIGGVVGSVLSGPATDYLGARGVFFFASIGPLVVLGFSLTMHESKSRVSAKRFVSSAKRQFLQLKGAVLTPVIWKCALWVFLSGAVSPGYSQVFFYFSTDVLKFTPEFLGTVSAFGFAFLLLGTLFYNAFFKDVSFRRIFLIAQLSLAVVSLLDVILVTRTNLQMGIPDKAFVLGDAVIADVVSRLKTMPVLVLCAKLCPKGIEGTLFALLMSISNCSFSVSEFWGAFICHSLGIQKDAYDDLWIAIVLRSLLKLTPILFLFLIPTSDPQEIVDRINFHGSDEEEEEEDGASPHGVIRADHMVNGSPDATPAPRNAPQKLEVAE